MDHSGGHINEIRNIIDQVQTTEISIGHAKGKYISNAQIDVIIDSLNQIEAFKEEQSESEYLSTLKVTPATSETDSQSETEWKQIGAYNTRLREVSIEITAKEAAIISAPKNRRSALNSELGKLNSEHSRLLRAIQKLARST